MNDYSNYRKTADIDFVGKGTAYFGQITLAYEPSKDYEVVNLGFLKRWNTEQDGIPVGPGTVFPEVDPASNNKCVYVNDSGVLTHPTSIEEDGSAQKVIGYLKDGKVYLNGHFIRGLNIGGSGAQLWIQPNGTMAPPETATENTWSIRMGHVIANGVFYVSIYNAGLV